MTSAVGDLIDFNVIESHKENIQALPSGRSAKALAQIYSPPLLGGIPSPALASDAHIKARREFEQEIQNIDEADDPLDVYDRYVKWTLDTYPSAQATPQSQLLPLLERATKAFQSSPHYKNDPRYLKLWLQYIRFFSDAPREVFIFLSRHGIGAKLALYYEEFAAWLENAGRWQQAEEIYQMGIETQARPVERLLRKFGEFERRNEAHERDPAEPSSPALPQVRPALAAKIDPYASASPAPAQQSRAVPTKKSKGSKMTVFADGAVDPTRSDSGAPSKGWDNIGSIAERKKENTVQARPWAGEKLVGAKTNGGMQKMMVFKDKSNNNVLVPKHISHYDANSSHQDQCTVNEKTGRLQYVFVNLNALYPTSGSSTREFCFEELRARSRRFAGRDWRPKTEQNDRDTPVEPQGDLMELLDEPIQTEQISDPVEAEMADAPVLAHKQKQRGFQIYEDAPDQPKTQDYGTRDTEFMVETFSRTLALNDENDENVPPTSKQERDLAKQMRREERANRTRKIQVADVKYINNETKTISINLDSPAKPKVRRKRSGERAEPTMTINTKEAMDEIYGIFNQALPSQTAALHEEDGESDDDDDYTTGDESTATGKLSGPASEYGDETKNELLDAGEAHIDTGDNDDVDVTNVTGWTEFTTSKHTVQRDGLESAPESTQATKSDIYHDEPDEEAAVEKQCGEEEEHDDDGYDGDDYDGPRTRYVPVPPEGYEPTYGQYRDPAIVANNRLPFMTPIVEQTESSLGVATVATSKSYFSVKTPSRKAEASLSLPDNDLASSPLRDVTDESLEDERKVLQPVRTKSTKGTLSLGSGTAKSQIAAKNRICEAVEINQKGPIITDEQCNPMDPTVREAILSQVKPSINSFDGYHEHLDVAPGWTADIKKYVRALSKAGKNATNAERLGISIPSPPRLTFDGTDATYTIKRELGAGTFAPVYLVENSTALADEIAARDDEDQPLVRLGKSTHRRPLEAIKMEEPVSTWEFYMLRLSHRRLGVSRASESIVRAHEMHLFRDECFLVEEYRDQGTLLDLVNIARAENVSNGVGAGSGMDETLAMWLAVELLRTVEALHSRQLIHGDLKGDNVLVRLADPGPETDWSSTYFPNGAHGWSAKGICLIDFGRGIDMRNFVPHVGFIADWATSAADCAEMREFRPWTYQIDYHGLAGVLHSMLFGKYMETISEKNGSALGAGNATRTYRIRDSLKRYWQTDIWNDAFSMLLNPLAHTAQEEGGRMPLIKGMRNVRERMETWLEHNGERGVGLKGTIVRMEAAIRERRHRGGK